MIESEDKTITNGKEDIDEGEMKLDIKGNTECSGPANPLSWFHLL